jgi:tetratricopeptide (TPR) repeat protein
VRQLLHVDHGCFRHRMMSHGRSLAVIPETGKLGLDPISQLPQNTCVDPEGRRRRAIELLEQAYREQMSGHLDEAIRLYQASLTHHPTAEAHTFLGWTYSFQGRFEDAIEECRKAIELDPQFGNPYNDIGSYLMQLGKLDAAIPWFERAIVAERYEPRHYPHCNLGRVYTAKGMLQRAIVEFEKALAIEPNYTYAQEALAAVRAQLN